MYDALEHKVVYADHYEERQTVLWYDDSGLLVDDWKSACNYLFSDKKIYCADILNYWFTNKPLDHIQWDNFYDQDDFTYYYPLDKMKEKLSESVPRYRESY